MTLQRKDPESKPQTESLKSGILSYDRWSPYFDMEDGELFSRLKRLINKENTSIIDLISVKPDLYVPVWGSFALIILIFIFGNIRSLLMNRAFSYDILSKSTSLIFGYVLFSPVFFYLIGKFNEMNVNILQILIIIGYSMLYFIPSIIISSLSVFFLTLFIFFLSFSASSIFLIHNFKVLLY